MSRNRAPRRTQRRDRARPTGRNSRRREAYSPSGVVAMAVIVPLCFAAAVFFGWVLFSTFVIEGVGLLESVTRARAPIPAVVLLIAAPLGIIACCRIGAQGAGWLYRVARGEVPRATSEQARGGGRWTE